MEPCATIFMMKLRMLSMSRLNAFTVGGTPGFDAIDSFNAPGPKEIPGRRRFFARVERFL